MKIEINTFRDGADPLSLYAHYDGQQEPQPVYVSIDTRDGELTIDYDGTVGNGTTEAIYRGLVRCINVPVIPTAEAANRLLADVAPLAQAWLDAMASDGDHTCLSDPDDCTVRDNADHSWSVLERAVADYGWRESDLVDVYPSDAITNDWIEGYDLAGATDDQIDQWADEILADIASNTTGGVAVCDGLTYWMRGIRDDLTASTNAGGR
jgi:hypothetical protein